MSAEFFQTILSADARTAKDDKSIEWAPSGSGSPRWIDRFDNINSHERIRGWITTRVYAHDALNICADVISKTKMNGITGDHYKKRKLLAFLIRKCAELTCILAKDAAYDINVNEEKWKEIVYELRKVL